MCIARALPLRDYLFFNLLLIVHLVYLYYPFSSSNYEQEVNWIAKRFPLRTIGPTIPSTYVDKRLENDKSYGLTMYNPKTDVCMKWLSDCADGSVEYISFGSMAELKEEQMKEIACG